MRHIVGEKCSSDIIRSGQVDGTGGSSGVGKLQIHAGATGAAAADHGGPGRAAGVGVWQHQSPQRHVGTHRGRAGRAGCHVGGLWRRDGSDVVPDGLGPEEAGEGVSHDQQSETVVCHRRSGHHHDRRPHPFLRALMMTVTSDLSDTLLSDRTD
ncbi:hypothetical protein F7725_006212 [Dissostichus mawsoni]|uniref:Uncharacterized protein n=1 Tax=Dissostichus mawsoni TaxID=36200 RepID=A0A7J5YWG9_DISMA|nr:hypothetical protein F7725_006212 [Dissostichus mawsoni]